MKKFRIISILVLNLVIFIQIIGSIVLITGVNPYQNIFSFLSSEPSNDDLNNYPDIQKDNFSSNSAKNSENNVITRKNHLPVEQGSNSISISRSPLRGLSNKLTGGGTSSITLHSAGGSQGDTFQADIGTAGNKRLVAIFADVENSGTNLGWVTVGGTSATLVVRADNPNGKGNHMELWVITETDLGSKAGNVNVQLDTNVANVNWALHVLVFYGVEDTTTAFDAQVDDTSTAQSEITPGKVNIPAYGLVIFGAANGRGGSYINTDWDSNPLSVPDDGLSPEIEMTEALDGPSPKSAVLADSYWISNTSQQNQRQFRANGDNPDNKRGTGIIASFRIDDTVNPTLNNYGVEDKGNGQATYWADVSDNVAVQSVTMTIDGASHSLTQNATGLWTYSVTNLAYASSTTYGVSSVVDFMGNSINPTGTQSYTFLNDVVLPTVNSATYIPNSTVIGSTVYNGTFKINVTDYGNIDTVRVNVTDRSNKTAILVYNPSSQLYETSSLFLTYGGFNYVVIANDTAGNSKTSNSYTGSASNYLPEVSSIIVAPNTPNTTQDLSLSYSYSDLDGQIEAGTRIRWYLNTVLLPLYNGSLVLPNNVFSKDDNVTVSVQPKDGIDFGAVYWSSRITIINSAPEVSSVSISPATDVKTTAILSAIYTYSDIDGDPENTGKLQVLWYKNGAIVPSLTNSTSVPSSYTHKGEVWLFSISVSDGSLFSSWVNSSSITIINTIPVIDYAYLTPTIAYTVDNLGTNISTSDADSDPMTITIKWYKDGTLQSSLNNLTSISSSLTGKHQVWQYTVQVFDGEAYSQILTVSLDSVQILNSVPIVGNVTLSPSVLYSNGTLTLVYDYYDADSDPAGNSGIVWYKDNVLIGELNGSSVVATSYLTRDSIWNATIQVFDGEDLSSMVISSQILVRNTPTVLSDVQINQTSAYTTSVLGISYSRFDQDSDPEVNRAINWYRNGVLNTTNVTSIPSSFTTKGEVWKFTIQVYDGYNNSNVYSSQNITILNSLPVLSNLVVNDGSSTQAVGTMLYINYTYSDADGDANVSSKLFIKWYRSGSYNSSFTNSSTVGSLYVEVNTYWYYELQAFDGSNYSTTYISSSVVIGAAPNIAPVASYVNITFIGGVNATTSSIFLNYTYSDGNSPPDNESGSVYYWYRNDVLMTQYTSQTLPSSATTKGEKWYAEVKPRDGKDFGSIVRSNSIIIGNTDPTVSTISISPSNPKTGNNLILNYTWADIDSPIDSESGTIIFWYVNGVHNSTFDNSTIILSIYTSKGQIWHVEVSPGDGTSNGVWVGSSVNITVINTAPTSGNVIIAESSPDTLTNLTASYVFSDVDSDQESGSLILWYRNGQLQPQLNNSKTIYFGFTNKTEVWYYTITPKDGSDFGTKVQSTLITIINSAPQVSNISFDKGIVHSNDSLLLLYDYSDADFDAEEGTIITWYKNNVSQPLLTNLKSIPANYFFTGDTWNVSIKVKDGTSFGVVAWSSVVVIHNTAPQITSTLLNPSNPVTTDTITLFYVYYDYDGNSANLSSLQVKWFKNGTYLPQFDNQSSLSSGYINKSDVWSASVRISDGTDYSNWLNTSTITVINTRPELSMIAINPSSANTTSNLQVTYVAFDADGDNVSSLTVKWFKNGNYEPQFDNQFIIDSSYINRSQSWFYKIVVTDGTNQSIEYTSIVTTIQNSAPTISNLNYDSLFVFSNGSIAINYTYTDADMDNTGFDRIFWYKNGVLVPELDGLKFVPSFRLIYNDTWWVNVIPYDGITFGQNMSLGVIRIRNTAPEVANYFVNSNNNATTSINLVLSYQYSDNDGQLENKSVIIVEWYRNSILIPSLANLTLIANNNTVKGQSWYARFRVFDGLNYSQWFSTQEIFIINTAPTVTSIVLAPAISSEELQVNYTYFDIDNDTESNSYIKWYRNGNYVSQFDNRSTIYANETTFLDTWFYTITPFDGFSFSTVTFQATAIQIQNTPPTVQNIVLSPNSPFSNQSITVSFSYSDFDGHPNFGTQYYWYRDNGNGTGFILMGQYNNSQTVPASALHYGDKWYVEVRPKDSISFGAIQSSTIVVIVNTPPSISQFKFIDGSFSEFYIEDETISVSYFFSDTDADLDNSLIQWYKSGQLVADLINKTNVPFSYLEAGDIWTVNITSYDGFSIGNNIIQSITVESRPHINDFGAINSTELSSEGLYTIWLNASDTRNKILEVSITVTLESNGFSKSYVLISTNGTNNIYSQNIDLLSILAKNGQFNKSKYRTLIGTNLSISLTVKTSVKYSRIEEISSTTNFQIIIQDNAPPRVVDAFYKWDDPDNPSKLTFFAEVEDFGGDIQDVFVYYYLRNESASTSGGSGASLKFMVGVSQNVNYRQARMSKVNESFYTFSLDFTPNTATDVLFDIGVTDSNGNSNLNAFPKGVDPEVIKAGRFIPKSFGIPLEFVLGFIVILVIFSFIAIKKFKSTELVGLDKEYVAEKALDLDVVKDVLPYQDLHTLGIMASFFDQRHGPIPIIIIPQMLKDNYELLVEMSDMSFSSARFSGNFEDETFSTYSFNPAPGQFISIISFGFALNRPEARGGAENITLNLLIHSHVSDLVTQFIDKFRDRIHEIHVLMDKEPDKKKIIARKIEELRLELSKIIISYEKLYGTTELLETYDFLED